MDMTADVRNVKNYYNEKTLLKKPPENLIGKS